MYVHIKINRKQKIGNFGKIGGGVEALKYILSTSLRMPAISRVCSSYNETYI